MDNIHAQLNLFKLLEQHFYKRVGSDDFAALRCGEEVLSTQQLDD